MRPRADCDPRSGGWWAAKWTTSSPRYLLPRPRLEFLSRVFYFVGMPPNLPTALLKALVPRTERDEILADLTAEYLARAAADGRAAARGRVRRGGARAGRRAWRAALPLLGGSGRREVTGHIPAANAYRPGGPMLPVFLADARFALRRLRPRPALATRPVRPPAP